MERLTGLDAGFVYMETPMLNMHTLKIAILEPPADDEGYSFERFKKVLGENLHALPPFRRRLVEVPGRMHHPVWIEDPDFDLDAHVRRVEVPAPGGRRERDAVIGKIASRQLDRSRPLWELWVLEGLEGGRFGTLAKIHHAAADGVAASTLLANVMSEDPDQVPLLDRSWRPEKVPSRLQLLRRALRDSIRSLFHLPRLLRRTWQNVRRVLSRRRVAPVATPLPIKDTPATSFNTALTPNRTFATAELALDDLKEVKRRVGVTLNDVVLGLVAEALRRYLRARGELPASALVAGVPVSTDKPEDVRRLGGNRVSNMFTSLRTDIADPLERLAAIHGVTAEAKVVQNLLGATMMQEWVEYTPPGPFSWFMREYSRRQIADRHRPPINLVVSNVPGPREQLYVAGATLLEIYSVGPILEGIGLNVTAWSYRDRLYVSALGCAERLPDLHEITETMAAALTELLAATAETQAGGSPA